VKRRTKRRASRARRSGTRVECPFCGEADDLYVDEGGGASQTYTEDCAVCCRPRVVHVEPGDEPGEVRIWLERGE
jgi:transcription elongation factor Elf1